MFIQKEEIEPIFRLCHQSNDIILDPDVFWPPAFKNTAKVRILAENFILQITHHSLGVRRSYLNWKDSATLTLKNVSFIQKLSTYVEWWFQRV